MKITPMPLYDLPHYLKAGYSVSNDIVTIQVESLVHTCKITMLPTQYHLEYFRIHFSKVCSEVTDKVAALYGLTSIQTYS